MTTEIIVNAICSEDKEVIVTTKDEGEYIDEIALENGDSIFFYVYDEREISIHEREKD